MKSKDVKKLRYDEMWTSYSTHELIIDSQRHLYLYKLQSVYFPLLSMSENWISGNCFVTHYRTKKWFINRTWSLPVNLLTIVQQHTKNLPINSMQCATYWEKSQGRVPLLTDPYFNTFISLLSSIFYFIVLIACRYLLNIPLSIQCRLMYPLD